MAPKRRRRSAQRRNVESSNNVEDGHETQSSAGHETRSSAGHNTENSAGNAPQPARQRYATINPGLDSSRSNPQNWYVSELRTKIAVEMGLANLPTSMTKTQLLHLYTKNRPANLTQAGELPNQRSTRTVPSATITSAEEHTSNVHEHTTPYVQEGTTSTSVNLVELEKTVKTLQSSVELLTHTLLPSVNANNQLPSIRPHNNRGGNTLSTTLTGPQTGRDPNSIHRLDTISPSLRREIIDGKDINLARLLMPEELSEPVADQSPGVAPKSDRRLHQALSVRNFTTAFLRYKRIITEEYSFMLKELDDYHQIIVNLSNETSDSAWYTYHKLFSAKAAATIQQFNARLDWGTLDQELYRRVFTARKSNMCHMCQDVSHSTEFCPLNAESNTSGLTPSAGRGIQRSYSTYQDAKGRPILHHQGGKICNNYQEDRCTFPQCRYLHICATCKKGHPRMQCKRERADRTETNTKDSRRK